MKRSSDCHHVKGLSGLGLQLRSMLTFASIIKDRGVHNIYLLFENYITYDRNQEIHIH